MVGWEDSSSTVLVAALDRIARYPARRRRRRVAANLLGDIWHSVWAQRQIELRHRAGCDEQVGLEPIDSLAVDDGPVRGKELMELIEEAVRQRITPRDGRLVALHRVLGYTNVDSEAAAQPSTIEQQIEVAVQWALTLALGPHIGRLSEPEPAVYTVAQAAFVMRGWQQRRQTPSRRYVRRGGRT